MSISERVNPDNLNIHQFQETPEGKPELPFDVEKNISEEEKQEIIQITRRANDEISFILNSYYLKILWPNEPRPSNEKEELFLNLIAEEPLIYELSTVFMAKVLYPEIKLNFEDSRWDIYIRKNFQTQKPTSTEKFMLGFINPEANITTSSDEDREAKELLDSNIKNNIVHAVHWATIFRLRDPSYKPNLTNENWNILIEKFKRYKATKKLEDLLIIAGEIKTASAYKVEFNTQTGINIQMYPPEDVNTSIPPIPENRKF